MNAFRQIGIRLSAAVVVLVAITTGSAGAAIDKCQLGIEKNGSKLEKALLKTFTKCADGYRKARVKNEALSVSAGPKCQLLFDKVLDPGDPLTTIAKVLAALDELPTLNCADADLIALGHLPTAIWGNRFARIVALGAIRGAYEQAGSLVGDFTGIMRDLATNGCTECANLSRPPCFTATCVLGAGTGATSVTLGMATPVTLTGVGVFGFCEYPGLLTNEMAVIGGPNRGLRPTTLGMSTVCNFTLRTAGVVNCTGGSAPTVSATLCQDSDLTDGNECAPGPSTVCQPDANASTGGACLTLSTAAAAAGQSFAFATSFLQISAGAGADGVACTGDDSYIPSNPAIIPITSASATASVLDYNNTNGNTKTQGPITGVAGPGCASLRAGLLTPGQLVGAFPAADIAGSPLGDTVTSLRLVCS